MVQVVKTFCNAVCSEVALEVSVSVASAAALVLLWVVAVMCVYVDLSLRCLRRWLDGVFVPSDVAVLSV